MALSRRELLLASHRHRLGREDLEDCYSQATLELLTRAGRGGALLGSAHIAKALEQKFLSRIHDRRRAVSGRSPIEAAIANSLPLATGESEGVEIADVSADVEQLVLLREDLRRIGEVSYELSHDQRLLLASQLSSEMKCGEFCLAHGWSTDKYRKVAQRARARLARLLAGESLATQAHSPVPLSVASRIRGQGQTYEHSSPHT